MVGSSVRGMGDGGRGESEPDDGVDAVPEFAAAALALVRDGVAVLWGVRHAALSAGELRALSREITALGGSLDSAGLRTLASMDAREDVVPRRGRGRRRSRSSSTPSASTTPPPAGTARPRICSTRTPAT